ncbi:MAG: hypothetical protein WC438_06145 [Candidatus Pacearchaeota archaeon]
MKIIQIANDTEDIIGLDEEGILYYWGKIKIESAPEKSEYIYGWKEMKDQIKNYNESILISSIKEALSFCQSDHTGLTDQDRKEIKSYRAALKNLEWILIKKRVIKKEDAILYKK